ncbi:MAG: MFS transporter [Candidatus Hodarchaeales archaeon]|jgi:MFS family permease
MSFTSKADTSRRNPFTLPIIYPNFGKLWLAQLVNNIGNQFTFLALQFLVFSLTKSTLAMGILAVCQVLPMILIGPYIGVLIDRFDRKRIMVLSNIIQAVWLLLIPLSVIFPNRVILIFLLAFLMGTTTRFFLPSRQASIPKLVDRSDLLSANSLSAATFQIAALFGPVTAGFLTYRYGYDLAFYIDMIGFLISALLIYKIHVNLKPGTGIDAISPDFTTSDQKIKTSERSVRSDLREAYNFLLGYPALAFLMTIFAFLLLCFGSVIVLMIPFLNEFTNIPVAPEEAFGIMGSLAALMGLIVALIVGRKRQLFRPLTLISISTVIASGVMLGFSTAPNIYALAFFWMFFGMIQVFVMIPFQTLAQETIPDKMRGKIFSFFNLIITSSQILGMAFGGIVAELTNIRVTFLILGIMMSVLSVLFLIILFMKNYENEVQNRRNAFQAAGLSKFG